MHKGSSPQYQSGWLFYSNHLFAQGNISQAYLYWEL